jgi:hypothetical protein
VQATEIVVGDPPEAWAALGFAMAGGTCEVGGVRIVAAGGEPGLRTVAFAGLEHERPDGLAFVSAAAPVAAEPAAPVPHPNGAVAVDHVVAFTDDLDRTAGALVDAGLALRRTRRPPEAPAPQAFLPAGTLVVELVQTGAAPSLWGLVVAVADLEAAAALLGDRLGPIRDAVQPGRRIATVRARAGLGAAVALMTAR